ncbi:hypothetical protein PI95_016140 [Hassallia byssoidea VB512170]|uniref:Uncharacterized protein n=1 Tax=Hassallia byssoidea VB512170 TaxID=1304833 RepID=A0A846HBH7_9CYAN|nr:hypothetical protein [Hassalia byssoidea]NEU74044.1 hypothetical protein [Hassalia byssoidea VB512170]
MGRWGEWGTRGASAVRRHPTLRRLAWTRRTRGASAVRRHPLLRRLAWTRGINAQYPSTNN